jgi:hypothetical protein
MGLTAQPETTNGAVRASALRVGDIVEVRSEREILATLDESGKLDALPFMPEMLAYCGKRFRVSARAYKACDTIEWRQLRKMESAVHLEDLRCDGAAHGGCQAGCLLYWKDAWLKRVDGPDADVEAPAETPVTTREALVANTRKPDPDGGDEPVYSCQATELLRATTRTLKWWEPEQYVEDVRSGNAPVSNVVRGLLVGFFNKFQQVNARVLPRFCLIHDCKPYPFVLGGAQSANGNEPLGLQPGDLVEVKSREEIFATLDERDRLRGLRFDSEMLNYCGMRARVLRRVDRIVDEQGGKMLHMKSDCIILEGVVCTGTFHRSCPRRIFPYWREAWLKRVA